MTKSYPYTFGRIATVTGVLPGRDSKKRRTIVRIARTNTIFKRPVSKLFTVENTYHGTKQTDKVREQKFTWEAAVISRQKVKYEC